MSWPITAAVLARPTWRRDVIAALRDQPVRAKVSRRSRTVRLYGPNDAQRDVAARVFHPTCRFERLRINYGDGYNRTLPVTFDYPAPALTAETARIVALASQAVGHPLAAEGLASIVWTDGPAAADIDLHAADPDVFPPGATLAHRTLPLRAIRHLSPGHLGDVILTARVDPRGDRTDALTWRMKATYTDLDLRGVTPSPEGTLLAKMAGHLQPVPLRDVRIHQLITTFDSIGDRDVLKAMARRYAA